MADFDIERPTVEAQNVQPTYNINPPQFTIEIPGGFQGQRGEKGDTGAPGRDGVDGTNGQDGQDGVSVVSIEQTTTSTESGGTNIITATLSNGDVSTFEIMNGLAGSGGGIETLEDPVVIFDLDDGYYRLPEGCRLYAGWYNDNPVDLLYTIDASAFLSVTRDIVANEPTIAYWIIEDKTTFTPDENNTYAQFNGNGIEIHGGGLVYYDNTGDVSDEFSYTGKNIKDLLTTTDVVDNLTSNSSSYPLSAKQGKVLKGLMNYALEFESWSTYTDPDYGYMVIYEDPYAIGDQVNPAFINTTAIKHPVTGGFATLKDVIDSKQNEITALNKLDYSLIDNQPTIPTNTSDLNNDSGFITSETDPVFSASAAAGIDTTDITAWNGKQDALVSGTNIKTINNNSLLGSGNITISGGGGTATDVQMNGVSIVVSDVANILTETAYDSSTNKLATMSDVPDVSGFIDKDVNNLTNYSLTTNIQTNKNLTKGVEYIVGTQASATSSWTGTSTDTGCSSGTLYTGKVIIYHLPIAGSSSAATLNLTLPDGTTTGAKNIYRQASSTVTTTFAADCDILMVYDGTQWKVNAYVDTTNSNSIGYQLRTDKGVYVNGASTSIYRYQLLVQTENGLEPFTSTSNKTAATKTQLSPKYLPGGDIRYYSSTTEITTGSDITSASLWMQYHLDLRYSFNITSTTLTAKKPVYMKMSVNADGTLSPVYSALSGGHPITQTLPTTADGYVYLHLGTAYSGYQLQLEIKHPMYEYKNGKLREYISETGGGGTITDVQVNSTSVVAGGVANVLTETAYDASTNKIATMSDLPTVPTNISSFVNDSGYITGISSGDVTTALGYTPYSSANPNGYTSNTGTITSVKMNGTTVSSSGEADLGTVLTSHQSIKTINSNSLLGSGNLTIGELKELTSPVSLKDLATGTYRVPANCVLLAETGGYTVKTTTNGGILMITQQTDAASFVYIDDKQIITPDYDSGVSYTRDAEIGCGFIYDTGPGNNNEYDYQYEEKNLYEIPGAIVNTLTSTSTTAALSAYQGKVLKDAIDAITIPTVNDSTITIQKNGTTVDSFTTNASSGKTINITVPTNTSELNNNSDFVSLEVIDTEDIYDITSTSDATYTKIKDLIDNYKPFRLYELDGLYNVPNIYEVIGTYYYSNSYYIWYIDPENRSLYGIKLTSSGSSVTVTTETKLTLSSTTWIDGLF